MEDRTFTVKTRNGEIFEIENAISEDHINETSREISRLKKTLSCCMAAAVVTLPVYFVATGKYIGKSLKERIYLSGPSKGNTHYHIKSLLNSGQSVKIMLLILIGVLLVTAFYAMCKNVKKKLRQSMHVNSEQTMLCHVVERIRSASENELAIEFERNAFGDPLITVVTKGESYVLGENIHRIPKTDDKNNRLRFLTDEVFYFKAPAVRKSNKV